MSGTKVGPIVFFVVALAFALLAEPTVAIRTVPYQIMTGGYKLASDTARTGNYMFGRGLAVATGSTNVIVVGEAGAVSSGGAYVFISGGTTPALKTVVNATNNWTLRQYLSQTVPGNTVVDRFGIAVAISANAAVIAVGAPRYGTGSGAGATTIGAVWLYNSTNPGVANYTFLQMIQPPGAATIDRFGSIVALNEDGSMLFGYSHYVKCSQTCAGQVAANRGVHVFKRMASGYFSNSVAGFYQKVATSEPPVATGPYFQQSGQPFGISPSGKRLWIMGFDQVYLNNTHYTRTAVNMYTMNGTGAFVFQGLQRAQTQVISQQLFGGAILLSGDGDTSDVFIAAPRNDSTVFRYAGPNSGATMPLQTFREGNAAVFDTSDVSDCNAHVTPWRTDTNYFGMSMSLSPNKLLLAVGAPFGIDASIGNGMVYLYRRFDVSEPFTLIDTFGSTYVYSLNVAPYDNVYLRGVIDEFGLDVVLSDTHLIVGAKGANTVTAFDGMAQYLVRPSPPPPMPPSSPPPPPLPVAEVKTVSTTKRVAIPFIIALILLLLLLLLALIVARWGIRKVIKNRILKKKLAEDQANASDDGVNLDE